MSSGAPSDRSLKARSGSFGSLGVVNIETARGSNAHGSHSEWDSDDDTKEVTTVYIGNLPAEVDEVILCVPFSSFGRIHSVQVRSYICWQFMPADRLLLPPIGMLYAMLMRWQLDIQPPISDNLACI